MVIRLLFTVTDLWNTDNLKTEFFKNVFYAGASKSVVDPKTVSSTR